MSQLSTNLVWPIAQARWAAQLNPLLANPLLNGRQVESVSLKNGSTTINHLLGQTMRGWYITDIDGAAIVYRSAPLNNKTLTLTSNAAVTVNLWVF